MQLLLWPIIRALAKNIFQYQKVKKNHRLRKIKKLAQSTLASGLVIKELISRGSHKFYCLETLTISNIEEKIYPFFLGFVEKIVPQCLGKITDKILDNLCEKPRPLFLYSKEINGCKCTLLYSRFNYE